MQGDDHDRPVTEQMWLTADTRWRSGPARTLAEPFLKAMHDQIHVAAHPYLPRRGFNRCNFEGRGIVLSKQIEDCRHPVNIWVKADQMLGVKQLDLQVWSFVWPRLCTV
jgi:hypothetical protein